MLRRLVGQRSMREIANRKPDVVGRAHRGFESIHG
jgi:hypothetical protein